MKGRNEGRRVGGRKEGNEKKVKRCAFSNQCRLQTPLTVLQFQTAGVTEQASCPASSIRLKVCEYMRA